MKADVWSTDSGDYFDVFITVTPYKHFSEEQWQLQIMLEVATGEIGQCDWQYAANQDESFEFRGTPPADILRAIGPYIDKAYAEIMKFKLTR